MANHLSMANIQAIAALHRSGHSNRHIARVLGVNRETVGRCVSELQNQPNPQTGSRGALPLAATESKAGPVPEELRVRTQLKNSFSDGRYVEQLNDGDRLTLTELKTFIQGNKQENTTKKYQIKGAVSELFIYEFKGEANLGLNTTSSINGSSVLPTVRRWWKPTRGSRCCRR